MHWWMLRRQVHVSWFIAAMCVAVLVGLSFARFVPLGWFSSAMWLVSAVVLLVVPLLRPRLYLLPSILVAGCLLGLWRGSTIWNDWSQLSSVYGETVLVTGTVKEDIDYDSAGREVLRLTNATVAGRAQQGLIWVTIANRVDIKRSDRITVRGELDTGFGGFVASIYDAELVQVERPTPGDTALHVRDWFADTIRSTIPEPQASLGIGYILGQKRALPETLALALQVAGLMHIVVASGYNLTILVRLARRLFARISKFLALAASGGMIVGFMAITGLSPSMSRAGLVAGLSLVAWYYGRRFHPLVLLPLAAAVTGFIEPSYVWGDLGWLLSFSAFAGVMLLAPLLQAYFFGDQKPGFIRQVVGETIAAFIMTAPILIVTFSQISNVAILANVLVLPLVPLAMLLTFATGVLSAFVPLLGSIVAYPTTWLLGYMTSVAEWLAGLPWALREVSFDALFAYVCYGGIVACMVYLWRKTKLDLGGSNIVE